MANINSSNTANIGLSRDEYYGHPYLKINYSLCMETNPCQHYFTTNVPEIKGTTLFGDECYLLLVLFNQNTLHFDCYSEYYLARRKELDCFKTKYATLISQLPLVITDGNKENITKLAIKIKLLEKRLSIIERKMGKIRFEFRVNDTELMELKKQTIKKITRLKREKQIYVNQYLVNICNPIK
jgi:hypothetical protein